MSADLRCSAQLRAAGAAPAATAGSYAGIAMVPAPLPWPADAADAVPAVASALHASGIRLQAVVADDDDDDGAVLHRTGDGPFTAFTRSVGPAATLPAGDGRSPSPGRDLLVCTHGSRDRCCGSFGARLWSELGDVGLPADVTLWRTSHLGGHRFAPTIMLLPEGTVWAWVTAELVQRIATRSGPVPVEHYRGCVGLPTRELQALEGAVLGEVGWQLLDTWRDGADLGDGRWRLTTGLGTWEATISPGRRWPVPPCGSLPDGAGKVDVELVVGDLVRR